MPTASYIADADADADVNADVVAVRVLMAGSAIGQAVSQRELRRAVGMLRRFCRNFGNVRAQAFALDRQLQQRQPG
ncbi:MAG: hypothetical protein ACK5N0_04755 [Synechococcaceae cyanobacterium]